VSDAAATPQSNTRPTSWNDSVGKFLRRFSSSPKGSVEYSTSSRSATAPSSQSNQGSPQRPVRTITTFSSQSRTSPSSRSQSSRQSRTTHSTARQAPVPTSQTQKGVALQRTLAIPPLSEFSSGYVPDSVFAQSDFILGAGMVIFEQNTFRVVVVNDERSGHWFFPKGRKDIGESLEQAALREAYEESGYVTEFFPLYNSTRQPGSPEDPLAEYRRNTEAVYITVRAWIKKDPVEYLTHWYVGIIPENAVRHTGTGMPDEQAYKAHLLPPQEAFNHLGVTEGKILEYVCRIVKHNFRQGVQCDMELEEAEKALQARAQSGAEHAPLSEEPQDAVPFEVLTDSSVAAQ
jgi:8-oxo-dGTP pyrophosphatase MutT (NUDIX family)